MIERTFVMIKPDGVKRALVGDIIKRFENIGLKLVGMKMNWVNEEFAKKHYPLDEEWAKAVFEKSKSGAEKSGKPFNHNNHLEFGKFIQKKNMDFLIDGPVVAMVWEGLDAITTIRQLVGVTKGREAEGGSIRGDFAMSQSNNLIHASDSVEGAEKETGLIFKKTELFAYTSGVDVLIYSDDERK